MKLNELKVVAKGQLKRQIAILIVANPVLLLSSGISKSQLVMN